MCGDTQSPPLSSFWREAEASGRFRGRCGGCFLLSAACCCKRLQPSPCAALRRARGGGKMENAHQQHEIGEDNQNFLKKKV